ncbi:ATP-binding cassette domain-containing protein [Cryptosporangium sp. NPDC048952]|uniref:ATP-binding cassette domain-containing protein n=1 Tax=Cryptosporangium sp. NPDC048952 TaxID=3363961 RepID=UPI0037104D0D
MSIETLPTAPRSEPPGRRSLWRRLLRDPQAVICGGVILLIVVVGLLAPLLTSRGPNHASLDAVNAKIGAQGYLLGGDDSGRDIYARLLYSINTSTISALIGTSIALVIGVSAGLVGGYLGHRTRAVTEWTFNLIMTFPGILALIVLLPVTKGDYRATMAFLGVLLSPGIYRIVRNLVLAVKNELYVDAARVSGLPDLRILGRHVLFAVRGPIIISAAFLAGGAITAQSGLAFLGVGSDSVPSFGAMINSGFVNLYRAPLQFLWPSLLLGIFTASLVLLGNALRDTLEGVQPKRSRSRAPKATVLAATGGRIEEPALLVVEDLTIAYPQVSGELREVVSGVSLRVDARDVVGLVGESGSGKTQTAFAVLGVLPAEAVVVAGSIRLDGQELLGLSERDMRRVRGPEIAYVPQEPMSNLDPSATVGAQLIEGLRSTDRSLSRAAARARVLELLARVGITEPERTFRAYPHEISGGMAQRVLIAGAIASEPKLLIADEPTTALDVTIQAEILDLLRDLQAELGMAVLLVTHNFGVVADLCDRIAVMHRGHIVETGDLTTVFADPRHAHTRMLLDAILDESHVRTDPPPGSHPVNDTADLLERKA